MGPVGMDGADGAGAAGSGEVAAGGRWRAGAGGSLARVGGEGEGEGAHDGGLDSALEIEELAGRRRARGSSHREARYKHGKVTCFRAVTGT